MKMLTATKAAQYQQVIKLTGHENEDNLNHDSHSYQLGEIQVLLLRSDSYYYMIILSHSQPK